MGKNLPPYVSYDGIPYQVLGSIGESLVIFNPLVNNSAAYVVPIKECTGNSVYVYNIGDSVRSFADDFHGRVTAIEEETNRVICQSYEREQSDRARFAYKPDEIFKV